MPTACIAIGSNVGDRGGHVEAARRALAAMPRTGLTQFSRVHETAPVGPAGQENYFNAAAVLETELEPEELMAELRRIERERGRERHERWGPRTLDLDLLLYGDRIINTDELTVPHPRMHERDFVLRPLAEIAPDVVHPAAKKSVRQLLAEVEDKTPPKGGR